MCCVAGGASCRPLLCACLSCGGRRDLFAKAGAALAGMSAVQAASAKAGQFSKIEIFSIVGEPGISSPFQPGGPKAGPGATFGYSKSEGEILATGYQVSSPPRGACEGEVARGGEVQIASPSAILLRALSGAVPRGAVLVCSRPIAPLPLLPRPQADVAREKEAFAISSKIVENQGQYIESKTWWLVRDNFRGQAYNMKANMQAIYSALPADKQAVSSKLFVLEPEPCPLPALPRLSRYRDRWLACIFSIERTAHARAAFN